MQQRARHLADNPEAATEMGGKAYDSIHDLSTTNQSMAVWEELERWN